MNANLLLDNHYSIYIRICQYNAISEDSGLKEVYNWWEAVALNIVLVNVPTQNMQFPPAQLFCAISGLCQCLLGHLTHCNRFV